MPASAENTAGYSFDQLFENADWALYQAKQGRRNQYVFCDNLRRYAQTVPCRPETADIDARYLHNDLISTLPLNCLRKTAALRPPFPSS